MNGCECMFCGFDDFSSADTNKCVLCGQYSCANCCYESSERRWLCLECVDKIIENALCPPSSGEIDCDI